MPKNKEDIDVVIPKPDTLPGPGLISLKDALNDLTSPRAVIGREQTSLNTDEDE